jgi:hypothetical protein
MRWFTGAAFRQTHHSLITAAFNVPLRFVVANYCVGGRDFARGEPGKSAHTATSAKNETKAAARIMPQA